MEICGEIYRLSSDIYGTMFKEFEILEDQTSQKKSTKINSNEHFP